MADEEALAPLSVDDMGKDLLKQVEEAQSKEDLDSVVNKIMLNNVKKDIIADEMTRTLYQIALTQAVERVKECPDELSTKELIDLINISGNQIDRLKRSVNELDTIDTPKNITQQETELSRESKEKIIDIINRIVTPQQQTNVIDAEFTNDNEEIESEESYE